MKTRFYLILSVAIGLAACTIMQVSYDEGVTWSVYQEQYTYRTCHNHINWGDDGLYNGYFNHYVFQGSNEISYDDSVAEDLDSPSSESYDENIQYFAVWR